MATEFEPLNVAIRDMLAEFANATHFIVNPNDIVPSEFSILMDDETGETYFVVEGYRVYPTDECPAGTIGACVPESEIPIAIGQA